MQFQRNDKKRSAQPASGGSLQRICSRQKSVRSGTARDSFSQTPHMRGKAGRLRGLQAGTGITPAHAGKSICSLRLNMLHRDHPRTCGEKIASWTVDRVSMGSPPHMRGKAVWKDIKRAEKGITPAHAGKRLRHGRWTECPWDHPRTCGEKMYKEKEQVLEMGSPPHMRGKERCRKDGV